jgi:hypothetical protein
LHVWNSGKVNHFKVNPKLSLYAAVTLQSAALNIIETPEWNVSIALKLKNVN